MSNSSSLRKTVDGYIDGIISGRDVCCVHERRLVERHLADLENGDERGLYFDEDAAVHAIMFFSFLRHSKGEWAGRPLDLEPWQKFFLWMLFGWKREVDGCRRFRTAYLEIGRKNGKALALDTPIPTINGWTTMGDVKVGDVLFDENGKPCRVVFVSDVMFGRPCYRVKFSDGSEIIADEDHLWLTTAKVNSPGKRRGKATRRWKPPSLTVNGKGYVYARLWRRQVYLGRHDDPGVHERFRALADEDLKKHPVGESQHTRIRTTKEIADTLVYGKRGDNNHTISVAGPLEIPEAELPVPPYTLGAWLGDGHSASARFTCADKDKEILDNIVRDGISVERRFPGKDRTALYLLGSNCMSQAGRNASLQTKLRLLGVLNNKHIPGIYLRASIDQRIALLQGLMDTDGHVSRAGQCEFTTTNARLAKDVFELICSLGYKPMFLSWRATLYGRDCGQRYRVFFFAYDDSPVFRLARKAKRLKKKPANATRSMSRSIVAVEPVDSVPVRCIQVDSPSRLYLAGRSMIPTHNTTAAAGVGLYMLDADGEAGSEIYSAATKKDQARISHSEAVRMVRASPFLRKRIKVVRDNLSVLATESKFEPLGRDADSLDGLNVHCAICDEVHAWKDRDMWDVLETATGARRQPLMLAITTAGFNRQSLCFELNQYTQKVLSRVVEDDTFLGTIFTIDDGDDYRDESVWRKSNPNLGVSVKIDDLRRKLAKAKEMPSFLNAFLRLHMNVWTQAESRWMPPDKWMQCGKPFDENMLRGKRCYAGLDLSSTLDITAWVLVFPPVDGLDKFYVLPRFFIPEDNIHERSRRDRVPYESWVRQDLVIATPGDVIDYHFIFEQIRHDANKFNIQGVAFDRWGATQIVQTLQEDLRLKVYDFGQGYKSMSPPMKELEKLIRAGEINHGGNPVLTWMADNVVVSEDPAGNIKPDKKKSFEKIDGIVALIMGLDLALRHARSGRSVYEKRGVLVL